MVKTGSDSILDQVSFAVVKFSQITCTLQVNNEDDQKEPHQTVMMIITTLVYFHGAHLYM